MNEHVPLQHVPGELHDPVNPGGLSAAGHGGDHGIAKYVYVFIALLVLTSCSIFAYSSWWPFANQPNITRTFMIAVSCCKAALVILFFMHVKYEANWKYVLTIPAGLMSIFLMLMLVPDIGMRYRTATEERKKHMAVPEPSVMHAVHGEAANAPPKGS